MSVALITGSAGLVGSEAAVHFAGLGMDVVGIDNDMRRVFFGDAASTRWNRERLEQKLGSRYVHVEADIRDRSAVETVFKRYGTQVAVIIHAAAQPSHDWAARDPHTDFAINADATLTLLEAARQSAPEAVFIFTSTNKVYGDTPNRLPFVEHETRWELPRDHTWYNGVREDMSVDGSLHSLFGASKLAADVLVQEYGRNFGMKTACFRAGCVTGPAHAAAELHGFLAYLMKCAVTGASYTVYGYGAKQVRDNIHSADLVRAFHEFFKAPRAGEVYNIGGGRYSQCSVKEAIGWCEKISGRPMNWSLVDASRRGDHQWWITDNGKFIRHYPKWGLTCDLQRILNEIFEAGRERWYRK